MLRGRAFFRLTAGFVRDDAPLDHRYHVFRGILAILLQPLCDDSHQPLEVKGHQLWVVSLRHAVALQDGREHMLKHTLVKIFQLQGSSVFYGRLK